MASNQPIDQYLDRSMEGGWQAMRQNIPEIKALVEDEAFVIITAIRLDIEQAVQGSVVLDVVAPQLLPHARAKLIKKGLIKEHNVVGTSKYDDGEHLILSFYGAKLIARLNIRKE